jgi:hypothetical protein
MTREELLTIPNVSESELAAAGADIAGLDYVAMSCFSALRRSLRLKDCAAPFVHNGLNSGNHQSEEHAKGKAIDFVICGPITLFDVIAYMVRAGFNGIGVYHNGVAYSSHGDIGKIRSWRRKGHKENGVTVWDDFTALINDPGKT